MTDLSIPLRATSLASWKSRDYVSHAWDGELIWKDMVRLETTTKHKNKLSDPKNVVSWSLKLFQLPVKIDRLILWLIQSRIGMNWRKTYRRKIHHTKYGDEIVFLFQTQA